MSAFQPLHKPIALQARLRVNEPGDAYERQADAMAEHVVNGRHAQHVTSTANGVQRKCAQCEEEEKRKLHRKEKNNAQPMVGESFSQQLQSQQGNGHQLDANTLNQMNTAFSADFSQVRIHNNATATSMNKQVNARAFTYGTNVYFNAGEYNTQSPEGKRLLAHELTHVLQQGNGSRSIQRDLALELPNPEAEGRVLSEIEMANAIAFNETVLNNIPESSETIMLIRDVLGLDHSVDALDEDFVNAVVWWQSANGLTQDGKLGPNTAARLLNEIGAEGAGKCEIDAGPSYSPRGTINVAAGGGQRNAFFRLAARFKSDVANGVLPSCCEVRQLIRWNAAAVPSFAPGIVPHAGFDAATPANRWVEDRDDTVNNRYGHRGGPFADPQSFDQYLDDSGNRNQAFGHIYRGSDIPAGTGLTGQWGFLIRVVDICNNSAVVGGQDRVDLNW